ncbi:hypothetical protein BLNAU_14567 [Blattamonas nauphoetae]|uniref:Secreted protein n=1 Tax=Blattamonas nauphoetae TaxID=2049346 RepID=A0ABQ9XFI5_9EUKA|nr:hypothetical protein BLNAU_14567 [Blattamonas nauphoetae]
MSPSLVAALSFSFPAPLALRVSESECVDQSVVAIGGKSINNIHRHRLFGRPEERKRTVIHTNQSLQ